MHHRSLTTILQITIVDLVICTGTFASQPSFTNDVMAVLSKTGCNAGACHGNQNGKGGFKLSLRGQDPTADYESLVRDSDGRRVSLFDPEQSLLLLKPTHQVAHLGGIRFKHNSREYDIVRNWILAGAPGPNSTEPRLTHLEVQPPEQIVFAPDSEVQIKVMAHFSGGRQTDVSWLACYETSNLIAEVSPNGKVRRKSFGETTVIVRFLDQQVPVKIAFSKSRNDFTWSKPAAVNYIDEHVFEKLKSLRINPSELSSDHVFLRRAYLDALGILPTADEARSFLADSSQKKRTRLIDALLSRPEFTDHWALKWSDLLRNEEKVLDKKGVEVFYQWIHNSFADGKPLDKFVHELVSARGSTYKVPPANYYRANRDPATRGETTARLFLGVRLQCAKCHNHPFDRWTQDDYYSWSALFARVDYELVDDKRQDKHDKNQFIGEQIVMMKDAGEVKNPRTEADASPRFLGAKVTTFDSKSDRLRPLADWLTSPENKMFARAMANLVWYHTMGRGIVEPIDDLRASNPPVNEPLLESLANDLVANGFDLRHLIRRIMNSHVYQLGSEPNDSNVDDDINFSRAVVRRLTAEQLLDAQCQVFDLSPEFNGYPSGTRAGQIAGVRRVRRRDNPPTSADRFLTTFGKPERLLACECERSNETTLSHALVFICGEGTHERISKAGNRLDRLVKSESDNAQIIEKLFLTALSRRPSTDEMKISIKHLESNQDRFVALQDIAWALINSKEFIFRH